LNPRHETVSVRARGGSAVATATAGHQGAGTVGELTARLRCSIGDARFERDFYNGSVFRQGEEGSVVIRVCSQAAADVLQRRYWQALSSAAQESGAAGVRFIVEASAVPAAIRGQPQPRAGGGARPESRSVPQSRRVSLSELVVCAQNRLAVDAARRAAEGSFPGGCLLYVHGGCGLGKTHILASIAEEASSRPGTSARCVSGEQFANEFIAAVKSDKGERMERFRRQYRSLDVLCIDDVQGLAGKSATQQELQHTIDALAARGARVAVSGSCHPRRIEQLADALVSRLMGGLVAEVLPPEPTAATRIVQALACRRGLAIDPAAAEAVALAAINDPRSASRGLSVRELEGIVTKVEAVHRLLGAGIVPGDTAAGGAVGMVSVNRALADRPEARVVGANGAVLARIGPRQPVRLEQVVALVCQKLGVTMVEVAGRGRHPRVVTRSSYPEIARAIGRPNHSTVITAHQRLDALLAANAVADCGDGRGERPIADALAECSAVLAAGGAVGQTQSA